MVTQIRNYITDIARGISKDRPLVDQLRRRRSRTLAEWFGSSERVTPPYTPELAQKGQPLAEEIARLQAGARGEESYWWEPEKAWKLVEQPNIFGETKRQEEFRKSQPGIMETYGQRRREEATGIERAVITPIKGINLSATDIVGLGAMAFGTYQAAKVGLDIFLRTSIARNMSSGAKIRGIEIPKDTMNNVVESVMREVDKKWLTKTAIKTLFKPYKGVLKFSPDMTESVNNDVTTAIQKVTSDLLPKFTPGGTAIPGQTKPLSEIMATATSELVPKAPKVPPVKPEIRPPMYYKEFIASGKTEAEWDTYAIEQNRLSRERGQQRILELWKGEGVGGIEVANLLRIRGITIPPSISQGLQHSDTIVSATSVTGRGMSRAEASAIHKWVSEQLGKWEVTIPKPTRLPTEAEKAIPKAEPTMAPENEAWKERIITIHGVKIKLGDLFGKKEHGLPVNVKPKTKGWYEITFADNTVLTTNQIQTVEAARKVIETKPTPLKVEMATATSQLAKEPWQMTKKEFINKELERYYEDAKAIGFTLNKKLQRKLSAEQYEKIIRQAVSEGKPVAESQSAIPQAEMAPSTSVQVGLAGMGKETAQAKMLEEVSGKGGVKPGLFDVEKMKAVEAAKPLPGQLVMEEVYQKQAQVDALKETLRVNPAAKLIGLIKKLGAYKGEVKDLTIKQYKDLTGKESVSKAILTKDGKHVRWEYALDDIATEKGFKSGEDLKAAIEQIKPMQEQIIQLEKDINVAKYEATQPVETPPVPEVPKTEGKPPTVEAPLVKEDVPVTPPPGVPPTGGQPPEGGMPIPPSVIGNIPPSKAPAPKLDRLNKIIEQSKVVVNRDRARNFTNLLKRLPGIEKVLKFERGGLKMTGESEKFLVGYIGESAARNDIATFAIKSKGQTVNLLRTNFGIKPGLRGKGALEGAKTKVKFIGTPEQAKNPIVGTIKDIADRPQLYDLSNLQKTGNGKVDQRNTDLLSLATEGYGAEIGHYPVKEGGFFLPTVDISKDIVQSVTDEMRAITSGRQKTRYYTSAAERMEHDPTFKPELNVLKLLDGMDKAKASAAGGQTFKQVIGGKNRLEVMQETHPALAKKMEALKTRLASLRGSAGRLDKKLDKAVTDFLASPVEGTDLSDLQSKLDVKLAKGPRAGMNIKDIQKEIDGVRAQIKALKPAWEIANLKPYQFIQQGIYKYFPSDQVDILKELLQRSNNPFLNAIENYRGAVFSGDASPILGVQVPVATLFDPIGAFMQAGGGLEKMIKEKNPLIVFSQSDFQKEISKDPESWAQFFSLWGSPPGQTPQEFAIGWLSKIPGLNAFNQSAYLLPVKMTKYMWDKNWKSLVKSGLPELDAKVAAMSVGTEVIPKMRHELLGQSQARATLLRALPTSYSFIKKPAELSVNAAKGFAKTITFQQVTAEELLSMKLGINFLATVGILAATSVALYAYTRKQDIKKAILDSQDPNNGKFWSIMVPLPNGRSIRVPIGGMYRSFAKAIYPQKVRVAGQDVYIPFAGLPSYLMNRINPAIRTQIDLLKNQDYYGQQIRKGDVAEQLWRILEYEFESALPLTIGTTIEGIRTSMPQEEQLTQTIGQFAGVTVIETKWYEVSNLRETYTKQDYPDVKSYSDLNGAQKDDLMRNHPDLRKIYDEAKQDSMLRGPKEPKVYSVLKDQAIATRDVKLNKAAQSLLDGEITKYEYDKERGYIRPYYSGQRNALWQFKEQLDPEEAKELEDYFNESSKPEDKALDTYWQYYSEVVETEDLPKDWDAINQQLDDFIGKYPANIQTYIKDNVNSWIKDLPQPARQVEEMRLSGIEDESWWDNYRGATSKKGKPFQVPGTKSSGQPKSFSDWYKNR